MDAVIAHQHAPARHLARSLQMAQERRHTAPRRLTLQVGHEPTHAAGSGLRLMGKVARIELVVDARPSATLS